MRMRLQRAGLWPPEQPDVPKRGRMFYFRHTSHAKAGEVSPATQDPGCVTSWTSCAPGAQGRRQGCLAAFAACQLWNCASGLPVQCLSAEPQLWLAWDLMPQMDSL